MLIELSLGNCNSLYGLYFAKPNLVRSSLYLCSCYFICPHSDSLFLLFGNIKKCCFPTIRLDKRGMNQFWYFCQIITWQIEIIKQKPLKFIIFQELIFASGASLLYLITSIIQLTVTSRIEYRITLQYYGYFGSYIVAGVSIL